MVDKQENGCVIVTGAAGGIGQALAHCFTEAGYDVVASDRCAAPAKLSCRYFVQADLQRTTTEPDYAEAVFLQIRKHIGNCPLKALINNAAVQILAPIDKLDRQAWFATLGVNLLAPFFWSQAFLPELSEAEGSVINISSIHAHLTKRNFAAYATSKAALSALTRSMAIELGSIIRVLAIEPAAIDTEMLRAGFADDPAGLKRLYEFHPTRCIGSANDLARLALTLTQLPGRFLTGTTIGFDGAIRATLHDPG